MPWHMCQSKYLTKLPVPPMLVLGVAQVVRVGGKRLTCSEILPAKLLSGCALVYFLSE